MINIRVLNNKGNELFENYIEAIRSGENAAKPSLNTPENSELFIPVIEIDENKTFNTRFEFGKYLSSVFENANLKRKDLVGKHTGMWNWLSYAFFEQLCPLKGDSRKVNENARYLLTGHYTDYFRHYVFNAYDLYSLYGDNLSYIFLYTDMSVISDLIEVFSAKQLYISSRNIVEVITKLYYDPIQKRPKSGYSNRDAGGDPRRLKKVIDQFDLTYDIFEMSADEIIKLLPPEFDKWKN